MVFTSTDVTMDPAYTRNICAMGLMIAYMEMMKKMKNVVSENVLINPNSFSGTLIRRFETMWRYLERLSLKNWARRINQLRLFLFRKKCFFFQLLVVTTFKVFYVNSFQTYCFRPAFLETA